MRITPEQRRFLGPARTKHDWVGAEEKTEATPPAPGMAGATPPKNFAGDHVPSGGETFGGPPGAGWTGKSIAAEPGEDREPEEEYAAERPRMRRVERRSALSRVLEVQNIVLLAAGLVVLLLAFYAGKRFDYWRYLMATRRQAQLSAAEANKYPNQSADELVERAMGEEQLGNWKEAADRLIAAKYRSPMYPGLLHRAGKLYYDHGVFDAADMLFDRAIAFKEDIDTSNYYRGMIANGRGDYAAAERFYEAASNAAPFNADYLYSWAETLRRDRRPKDALSRYDQAAMRAREAEANICRFKIRMAMIESGNSAEVANDLEAKKATGALSVDWLMTDAALRIQDGQLDAAVRLIQEARISDRSLLRGHFAACAGDKVFSEASNKFPEIAEACRLQNTPLSRFPLGR